MYSNQRISGMFVESRMKKYSAILLKKKEGKLFENQKIEKKYSTKTLTDEILLT